MIDFVFHKLLKLFFDPWYLKLLRGNIMLRLLGFFGNFFLGPWLVVLGMWSHHPGIGDLGGNRLVFVRLLAIVVLVLSIGVLWGWSLRHTDDMLGHSGTTSIFFWYI